MTKLLRQFLLIATLAAALGLFIVPDNAFAQTNPGNYAELGKTRAQGLEDQRSVPQEAYVNKEPQGGCSIWNLNILDCIYGTIGLFVWHVVIPTVGFVLWLVGMMIDGIVNLSFDPTFYDHPALKTAWSIIRDLCNMVFIFVLIYAGFQLILNLPSANLKKTVIGVVIAALLINFSYFITKVVIDVSNIGTAWFIQGVKNVGGGNGVSDSVRGVLQMEKLVKNDQFGENAVTLESFVTGLALVILTCVSIYVLFRVFFMLLGRLVSFMLLLVTAPVGFLRWVELPKITEFSKKWWDELLCQAMVAPMFFLMLYITLYIVDQVDSLIFGTGVATTTLKTGSFAPVNYVMFAIIIVMLLKALELSKDKGCELGNTVGDLFKSASGLAMGGVLASSGALLRQTAGRGMFAYTQDKEKMAALQQRAATNMFSRAKLAAINKGAMSSFDARATKLGGNFVGAFGKPIEIPGVGKVDAGKVGKTESEGFKGAVEKFKEDEKKWAEKNLGKGKVGEVNRMRYADSKQKSWVNNYVLNPGIRYKDIYDDLNESAHKAYVKADTEGAQKDAQKIKNQIIDEQIGIDSLKNAAKKDDIKSIDRALENELERANKAAKKFEEDKDNKLAYNRYKRAELEPQLLATDPEIAAEAKRAMDELDTEFAEATKNMTAAEKEELTKENSEKVKKVRDFEDYIKDHRTKIEKAKLESNISLKKEQIAVINKNTQNVRIGRAEWDKNANGGKGGYKEGSRGLALELAKKKKEIQDKKREQDILEGKTPKGKKKDEPPPEPEDGEEEEENK